MASGGRFFRAGAHEVADDEEDQGDSEQYFDRRLPVTDGGVAGEQGRALVWTQLRGLK